MLKTANLKKILRTLSQYKADTAIIACDQTPQIFWNGQWELIKGHPVLNENALISHLKDILSIDQTNQLFQNQQITFQHFGDNFILELQKNQDGEVLVITRLSKMANLEKHPQKDLIGKWLKNGGIMQTKDLAIYSALLEEWSKHSEGNGISLERNIHYPAKPFHGSLHQKKIKEHFIDVQDGFRLAESLKAKLIAIKELNLSIKEEEFLNKHSKIHPVLLMLPPISAEIDFDCEVLSLI